MWVFAVASGSWTLLRKLPHGLHSHSATAWSHSAERDKNTLIIVSGGLSGDSSILSANPNIYVINPRDSRSTIDVIRTRGPYIPRFAHTSHVHRSRLLLVGGVAATGCVQPGVGIVDLVTGDSVELQLEAGVPAADVCLYNHGSCLHEAEGDRARIFAFGGGGNCFSFGCHFSKRCLEIDVAIAIEHANKGENGA